MVGKVLSENVSIEGFDNPSMATMFREVLQVTTPEGRVPFLRATLEQQKTTAENLLNAARKISPVAQKTADLDATYDAAFESDTPPDPTVGISSTLQGFTIFFLFASYAALAFVCTSYLFSTSGNLITSGVLLLIFGLGGLFLYGVIRRFG